MDPKSFYKLLENPEKISSKELNELSDILVNHPYFSSAHLLYALGNLERKSPGYEKKIQEHTIFIKNKNRLLDHFYNSTQLEVDESSKNEETEKKNPQSKNQPKSNSDAKGEAKTISTTPKDVSEVKKEQEKKTEAPIVEKPDTEKDQKVAPKAIVKSSPQLKPSVNPAKKNSLSKPSEKTDSGDLADRVMASLAQMKKDRENKSSDESKAEGKKIDDSAKTPTPPKNKSEKESTPDNKTESKPTVSNPKKTKLGTEKAKSTTSKKTTGKKEPIKRVTVKSKPDDKKALDSKADKKGSQKGQKDTEKPESTRVEHKLIDNFIAADIKIKPVENSSTEEKIEDLSKKSTTFHSHLISENLANIFEKQGKKDKAKVIFEQLQLKYPEKKAYFAAKINNLDS